MPKNILVDLNVILDVLLARTGFEASLAVLQRGEQATVQLWISAHMATTFAYLLEAAKVPPAKILEQVNWLLASFKVVPTDDRLLKAATESRLTDYEDAVVEQAAIRAQATVIITRNVRDFRMSIVIAQTPRQYLGA